MNQLDAADKAVRLRSSSSDAHFARARLLSHREQRAEAIKEYERAVTLRPQDYVLSLELGRALDQANDVEGALVAFRESERLAPFYAQPHWQLGNALLRSGRRDEALAQLRRATASDPKLLPAAINLAWAVFNGDPIAVEQAIQPQTAAAHVTLAIFFAKHRKAKEAIIQFHAAGGVSNEQRRALLTELLAAKNFTEAYEVWISGHDARPKESRSGTAAITDGSFESDISLDDPGFGWQLARDLQAMRVSLDTNQPHSGASSMRLSWTGDSNPSTPVVSQIVLVEPSTHYRLNWAVRTEELLTIGLPIVTVSDASSDKERVPLPLPLTLLAQSKPIPQGTSGWQDYFIDFTTDENTRAVLIAIRRQPCAIAPCVAIGHVWVDDFSLAKLE